MEEGSGGGGGLREGGALKTQIHKRWGLRDAPLGQNKWRTSLSVQSHITDESDVVVSTKTHHSYRDFN